MPVRTLEVGVCGTDRRSPRVSSASRRRGGRARARPRVPRRRRAGRTRFARGDLVTRSCVAPAGAASPATRAHRLVPHGRLQRARDHAAARVCARASRRGPAQLIGVPRSLGRLGVLVEPASICERGIRHARTIGGRQPWELERALVLGSGAIGVLSTYILRLAGLDVWTAARSPAASPKAQLAAASGARYVSTEEQPLAALREEVGGFDLVVEATGNAQVMADSIGMLRRSGVACLLGLDSRRQSVELDGRVLGVDAILENRVVFGSVNANRVDWLAAVASLGRARERWPDVLPRSSGSESRSIGSRRRSSTTASRPRSCSTASAEGVGRVVRDPAEVAVEDVAEEQVLGSSAGEQRHRRPQLHRVDRPEDLDRGPAVQADEKASRTARAAPPGSGARGTPAPPRARRSRTTSTSHSAPVRPPAGRRTTSNARSSGRRATLRAQMHTSRSNPARSRTALARHVLNLLHCPRARARMRRWT